MTDFSSSLASPGMLPGAAGISSAAQTGQTRAERGLRQAAQELEASFLAEMLKAAGFGKARDSFGGGAGEDQFASFLRQAQATEMAKAGGIGLAEALYQALKEKNDDK